MNRRCPAPGRRYGFILNFLLWVIVEGALWGIGAAARKAVGKPLTKNGIAEEWTGGAAAIAAVAILR